MRTNIPTVLDPQAPLPLVTDSDEAIPVVQRGNQIMGKQANIHHSHHRFDIV